MATAKESTNSRINCSVCLEPFRGRQPKLLPCFHTFCLPCLTRLADKEKAQVEVQAVIDQLLRHDSDPDPDPTSASGGLTHAGEGDKSPINITCPTCRHVIPVPPGGVTDFQTNFYIEEDYRGDNRPVLCDLCNGEEEAQYRCSQCHNSFCIHCQRYHSTTCQGAQVTELQNPSDTGRTAQGPASNQVRRQVKMVEDCLEKLREDKEKLTQEREAMENEIHLRYATLLRRVGDVLNTCLTGLRQVCDDKAEQIDTHMTEAQQALDTLQQQLSGSPPDSLSQAQQRAALFVQGDLQTILNSTSSTTTSLLRHEVKDNPPLLADCLESFMGKVVECSHDPDTVQSREAASPPDLHSDQGVVSSGEATTSSPHLSDTAAWDELCQKVNDLASQVSSLQAANTQLTQHVTMLNNANSTMSAEQNGLQREVTGLRNNNSKLTSDLAALQGEVTGLKDKNAIVHQDLAVQTAEKVNMHAHLAKLQTEMVTVQTECSALQSNMEQDVDQLKAECCTLKTEYSTLKSDVKKDIDQLKTESSALTSDVKNDVVKLKSDLSTVQIDACDLKRDHSSLCADLKASENQLASIAQKVQTAHDSLQDKSQKITALESRFLTANRQVSFHVVLENAVTISYKQQTLICDRVISNEGNGYNKGTGVFTAPVSGTYCFMVNAGPNRADDDAKARLDVVLENSPIGYVASSGSTMSTGHTTVRLNAGQRVWLRTYRNGWYTFCGGWWTCFSGMLLQPNV